MALRYLALITMLQVFMRFVSTLKLEHQIIYVDTINGINESSCWFGGVQQSCKSLSLAVQGKHRSPNAIIAVLQSSLQQQNLNQDIRISKENCYPWMVYNETSGTCKCSDIPNRAVLCDPTIPRTSVLDCYCMTYNTERDETELGKCSGRCYHGIDTLYNELPKSTANLTEHTCEKDNRALTLCGKCKPGYSPLVYSYDMYCMNCTGMAYNWIKYIAVAYVPLTFFFLLVIIFRFNGSNPWMRAFISICQGIASPIAIRSFLAATKGQMSTIVRILGSIYGIFNLDFFRTVLPPICLDITPLQALALDYAIAFYPLLLVLITYILIKLYSHDVRIIVWLWKPFYKCFGSIRNTWDLEGSVLKAFATFFILSYLKMLDVSFDLLIYTEVYTLKNSSLSYSTRYVLYYDASIEYFGKEHLPYAVLALFVMTFVVLLPVAFLIIYPMRCFQRCLNSCHIQRQSLDIWVNCYQGYYKDGTNGTRDCRCFSAVLFLLQIIIFILYMLSRNSYCYPMVTVFVISVAAVQVWVQPYKESFRECNVTDIFLMLNLASIMIMATAVDVANFKAANFTNFSSAMCGVLACVPLVYIVGLSVWWFASKKKYVGCCFNFMKVCIQKQEIADGVQSNNNNDLPHRLENPTDYTIQDPLLDKQSMYNKYGTVTTPRV